MNIVDRPAGDKNNGQQNVAEDNAGSLTDIEKKVIEVMNENSIWNYNHAKSRIPSKYAGGIQNIEDYKNLTLTCDLVPFDTLSPFGVDIVCDDTGIRMATANGKHSRLHKYPIDPEELVDSKRFLEMCSLESLDDKTIWKMLLGVNITLQERWLYRSMIEDFYNDDHHSSRRSYQASKEREEEITKIADKISENYSTVMKSLVAIHEPLLEYCKWKEGSEDSDDADSIQWRDEIMRHRHIFQLLEERSGMDIHSLMEKSGVELGGSIFYN